MTRCTVCISKKKKTECPKCKRIYYCSEECMTQDVNHKYICREELKDYIDSIIYIHKYGQCQHNECLRPSGKNIILYYGQHNIRINNKIIMFQLASFICVICGSDIKKHDQKSNWFNRDGYCVIYQRCNDCLEKNYYLCPSSLTNKITCVDECIKKVVISIITMKHILFIPEDIKMIIIWFLIEMRCCKPCIKKKVLK